jgi:hypothetical protein
MPPPLPNGRPALLHEEAATSIASALPPNICNEGYAGRYIFAVEPAVGDFSNLDFQPIRNCITIAMTFGVIRESRPNIVSWIGRAG